MIKQLLAQVLNGFSAADVPFLILQISFSVLLMLLIRKFWVIPAETSDELKFIKYLTPIQIVLTTLAIFSQRSPWMIVLFGIVTLIPFIGRNDLGFMFRVLFTLCIFIAIGCGAANLIVTILVTIVLIIPSLFFISRNEK